MTPLWKESHPFVIVATSRGGGTFLSHCLDSHIDVGCERGEPLHPGYIWGRYMPMADPNKIADLIWRRPGYMASGFKTTYRQFERLNKKILHRSGVKIIHLHRENVLRVALSAAINSSKKSVPSLAGHPTHTYESVPAASIQLKPERFLAECDRYVQSVTDMLAGLASFAHVLALTYNEITGGETVTTGQIPDGTAARITDFLEVEPAYLHASLVRVNPQPMSQIVTNWDELKQAIRKSEHRRWLAEEVRYE